MMMQSSVYIIDSGGKHIDDEPREKLALELLDGG
jgi:hypothetical protein